MAFPHRTMPKGVWIEQALPADHIDDPRGAVYRRLMEAGLREKVRPHARIAITAGSRGIGGFVEVVSGIAAAVRDAGGDPFVVPAMGSHGGATSEGQTEILNLLGVREDTVGAPLRATMGTIEAGVSETGAVAHVDRFVHDADGVIVMGRVKTHPESAGELASGLLKMCTVGLGKQRGAQQAHNHGLWGSVRAVPKLQLAKTKVLFGVAVVENAFRQPLEIEVAQPNYGAFLDMDTRLLNVSKSHFAKIPFTRLDLLIVDELGKTVSGAGMDPNVIGLWRNSDAPHVPDYRRIVVLSLTPASLGNGLGIGMADYTTQRFVDAYDPAVSYVNLLTATEPGGNTREGPMPLALPSDREAIEVALYSALPGDAPKVCRIKNTAELSRMWVSEGLLDDVKRQPALRMQSKPEAMAFNNAGNLL